VGQSALSVVQHVNRREAEPVFEIDVLSAQTSVEQLAEQAKMTGARLAVIGDEDRYGALKAALAHTGTEVAAGPAALAEAAARPVDRVLAAIVGIAGLRSTHAALKAGNAVALANKESMVCAGPLLNRLSRKMNAPIIPTDSEHNAMFQVLERQQDVEALILTASGGPFLDTPLDHLHDMTPDQACAHPRWTMGRKISVDSATFMNKALELIEAAYLFDMSENRIDVLVHPQSVIHSMVSYVDGSVLAQLGTPDMKTPIAHALTWPENRAQTDVQRLNLVEVGRLDFRAVDNQRFPAIDLARQALRTARSAPIVMNAANETAVDAFLEGRCRFTDINWIVSEALSRESADFADIDDASSIEDIIQLDRAARDLSERLVSQVGSR
jgi:1-deoxy-D-xylulose-5-phosphate reductoisomerase